MPDEYEARRRRTAFAIRCTDGEDQIPLSEKRSVGGKDRVARVVNARCFGGSAVQFELAPDGQVTLRKVGKGPSKRVRRLEAFRGFAGEGLSTDEIMALTRGDD